MDDPRILSHNLAAPHDERSDAFVELANAHCPSESDLIPSQAIQPVIDLMRRQAPLIPLQKARVIEFPSGRRVGKRRGMVSMYIDDMQVAAQGEYYDRPGALSFASMRHMVDRTPVLSAAVLTRVRQVQRFCAPAGESGPGFRIAHVDGNHELDQGEEESINKLTKFLRNSGWEWNPRRRKRLRRDAFPVLMAKLTRDSLTMDSTAIETEMRKDKRAIDGIYAVDGETIRLCTEDGYDGDDAIFALQVVQGRIVTGYSVDDLIYEPRNPRTDVLLAGYGLGEVELMVRVVTGFLNAMSYNVSGFDQNAIPKGMLHLSGNYGQEDIDAFKRWWNAQVRGVTNAWALPVMVSQDQESRAAFERFGIEFNEMYFAKWMTFLVSIMCAIFGMSPSEINFDSFTGGNTSALSGSDTSEKLAASKDSGLRPLLAYFEGLINEYIISDFGEKYAFEWTGLDDEDDGQRFEMRKSVVTVNEARQQEGFDALKGPLGDAPLNPSLVGPWMQLQQQTQAGAEGMMAGGNDFGQVPEDGQQEEQSGNSGDFGQQQQRGDFGKSFAQIYAV